jgi:hypothetical protein
MHVNSAPLLDIDRIIKLWEVFRDQPSKDHLPLVYQFLYWACFQGQSVMSPKTFESKQRSTFAIGQIYLETQLADPIFPVAQVLGFPKQNASLPWKVSSRLDIDPIKQVSELPGSTRSTKSLFRYIRFLLYQFNGRIELPVAQIRAWQQTSGNQEASSQWRHRFVCTANIPEHLLRRVFESWLCHLHVLKMECRHSEDFFTRLYFLTTMFQP